MKRAAFLFLGLALLSSAVDSAIAADRVEKVKFSSGASSAERRSALKGYDGVEYRLDARAGQIMQVLFSPSNRSCYFNVLPPSGDEAIFNGSVTGNEFAQNLAQSGTYTVQVYLMRNAARRSEVCKFTISFEISG